MATATVKSDPIKRRRLYDYLYNGGMTTLSYEDFSREYSTNNEKFGKLYGYLKSNNQTTLNKKQFKKEYFGDISKKKASSNSTAPSQELASGSESTSSDIPTIQISDEELGLNSGTEDPGDLSDTVIDAKSKLDDTSTGITKEIADLFLSSEDANIVATRVKDLRDQFLSGVTDLVSRSWGTPNAINKLKFQAAKSVGGLFVSDEQMQKINDRLESLSPEKREMFINNFVEATGNPIQGIVGKLSAEGQNEMREITEEIQKETVQFEGNIIDDLNDGNYGQAAYRTLQGALNSAPSMAMAMAPGGLVATGVTSFSGKVEELDNEGRGLGWDTFLNAGISGTSEALLERYTRGSGKQIFKYFKGKPKEVAEAFSKNLVATILKDIVAEAGTEGLTEFTQGLADKLISGKDISMDQIVKNAVDGAIIGGAMGGGTGGMKSIQGYVARKTMNKEQKKALDEKTNQIIGLEAQMQLPEVPEELKSVVQDKIDVLKKEREEIIGTELERVSKTKNSDIKSVFEIDEQIKNNIEQSKQVAESGLSNEAKERILEMNQDELLGLQKTKEALLDKEPNIEDKREADLLDLQKQEVLAQEEGRELDFDPQQERDRINAKYDSQVEELKNKPETKTVDDAQEATVEAETTEESPAEPQPHSTENITVKPLKNAEFEVGRDESGDIVSITNKRTNQKVPKFVEATRKNGTKYVKKNPTYSTVSNQADGITSDSKAKAEKRSAFKKAFDAFDPVTARDYALQYLASGNGFSRESIKGETGESKGVSWLSRKNNKFAKESELPSIERASEIAVQDAGTEVDVQQVRDELIDIASRLESMEDVENEVIATHEESNRLKNEDELRTYLGRLPLNELALVESQMAEDEYLDELSYEEKIQYYEEQYGTEEERDEAQLDGLRQIDGEPESGPSSVQERSGEEERPRSPELEELDQRIDEAQEKVRRAETALQNKAQRLDRSILDDQEDLFGERASQNDNLLFDERVDLSERGQATEPEREAVRQARERLSQLQGQRNNLEESSSGQTQAIDFEVAETTPDIENTEVIDPQEVTADEPASVDFDQEIRILKAVSNKTKKAEAIKAKARSAQKSGQITENEAEEINQSVNDVLSATIEKGNRKVIGERDDVFYQKNGNFTEITKEQFDNLLNRLNKAFPQTKVVIDRSKMQARLNQLGNIAKLQIFPFEGVPNEELRRDFERAKKLFRDPENFLSDIWRKTGFFLRQNTNTGEWEWAYRIDQRKMKVKLPARMGALIGTDRTLKLGDILDYPRFFRNFPDAKNIDVSFEFDTNDNYEAKLSDDGKALIINTAYYGKQGKPSEKRVNQKRTLAHELQHFVQIELDEGGGTSRKREAENYRREISERGNIIRRRLLEEDLSEERRREGEKRLSNISEAIAYLDSGRENPITEAEQAVERIIQKKYHSNTGEREARLAETNYKESPYKSYNDDATAHGIDKINFEQETKDLRKASNKLTEQGDIQFLKIKNGEVYGFIDPTDGTIYIDPENLNANTPIHEFGHLWQNVLKNQFPEIHKKLITAAKRDKKKMDEVRNDPAYSHLKTEEQIADEVLARSIGDVGEKKFLREEGLTQKEQSIRQRLYDLIQRAWRAIKKRLGATSRNIREWTDKQWEKATLTDISDAVSGELLSEKMLLDEQGTANNETGDVRFQRRDTSLSDSGPVKDLNERKNAFKRFWNNTFRTNQGAPKRVGETVRSLTHSRSAFTTALEHEAKVLKKMLNKSKRKYPQSYNEKAQAINDYLSGDKTVVLTFLNEAEKADLRYLRARIDVLSDRLIVRLERSLESKRNNLNEMDDGSLGRNSLEESIERQQNLIDTIKRNKGSYLHRSYQAFNDDKYLDAMLSLKPSVGARQKINNAVKYIIDNSADLFGENITEGEARNQVYDYLDSLRGNSDFVTATANGKARAPFLKKRKDIPKPIRELLGEVKDPIANYVNTVFKVSDYIATLEYQERLLNDLTDMGMTSANARPGYTRLAPDSEGWHNLSGVYVPEGLKQAIDDLQPLERVNSGFYRGWIQIAAATKVGKTVLSITTTARNILSGMFLGLNAGFVFFTKPKRMVEAIHHAFGSGKSQTEMKKENQKLIKLGVANDGAVSGEILATMNDFSKSADRMLKKNMLEKALGAAQTLYKFGDDFYKIIGFYVYKDRYMNNGFSQQEAEAKAAERISNTFPTYSKIPKNFQRLRRVPVVGSFPSFSYEVWRTTYNGLKYINEDFKEGRNSMAWKQVAGMVIANGTAYGLYVFSSAMLGFDDEDDDFIRDSAAPWQRNSLLIYTGVDNGKATFIDATAFFPSETIIKPLRTLLENREERNVMENVVESVKEAGQPFLGLDISFQAGIDILNNSDTYGRSIYEGDDLLEGIVNDPDKIATYILEKAGPGTYNNLKEFAKANNIAPWFFGDKMTSYGREYTNRDALLALFGFRFSTVNFNSMLSSRGYEEREKIGYERSNLNRILKTTNELSKERIKDVFNSYKERNKETSDNIITGIGSARKMGVDEKHIFTSLDLSGYSNKDIRAMMQGNTPLLKPISRSSSNRQIMKLDLNYTDNLKKEELTGNYLQNVRIFNQMVNKENARIVKEWLEKQ